jgi:immune inhibitor A
MKIKHMIHPVWLTVLCITMLSTAASAMPPHPDLERRIESGEVAAPKYLLSPRLAQEMGLDQPSLHLASQVYPTGTGPVGNFNLLVLLVQFSDNSSVVNPSFFDTLIFANQTGCVHHYYQEISYGTLDILTINLPSGTGWYTAPQTYTYYVDGHYGVDGAYPHNCQKLVEDLVDLADPYVDFSHYDNDGDGYVDALVVVHAGPGAEFTGDSTDVWSHKWGVTSSWSSSNLKDGVQVWDYTMQPEYWLSTYDMTCGVYCHELGHVFGLPDLYDTDYSSYGIGKWSLMAGGSWNGYLGDSPAWPDVWCLSRLGYVTPTLIVANTSGVSVPEIENSPVAYKLWTNGLPGSQYFLVSNRQKTGYDSSLPAEGLLIWHVDEGVSDYGANDHEWYPGHTAYGHYKVALEQADGLWQLESTRPFGPVSYVGDPFPGITGKRTFNGSSVPNSNSYATSPTYVAVQNVSNSLPVMTCDLFVSPAGVEDDLAEAGLSGYELEQNYPNPFNPQTNIRYTLIREGWVEIEIFNLLGERIRTLAKRTEARGEHSVRWDGTDEEGNSVPSGVYFCRLRIDDFVKTDKMVLLK